MSNTKDTSTEDRIKAAARKVFHQKGYAGTRTRDIAEEAGINHAMLNYYFRSKEKLFEIVMMETMAHFFQGVGTILNDESTSLEEKIERVVANYIDLLLEEPELPTFMFNEVRANPEPFVANTPIIQALEHSVLAQQYAEAVAQGRITEPNLIHTVLNVISLVIFPFIAQPIFTALSRTDKEAYKVLMLQRKTLIPQWIKAILFLPNRAE
ncbi:TetR/AcrR family transcriptional regulator [Capnocytophaga endodontalis]|uniref:TetR family transcriptional regulator n=1 Tax=Capnocytophaga endodontalis TaxID=2708117 RepID=A0A1Z4BQF6_9FLAO|nr:TetR/AcrR family transcriptional regulator [Capnocytophaga endodontalis]ASF43526.1 TetR family transcriptional regulator [Capnocytophaga endodontalis]